MDRSHAVREAIVTQDDATVERKIRATLLKYLHGVDRGDRALRLSAFAPKGKLYIDGVQVIGPEAVTLPDSAPPAHGMPPRNTIIALTHHLHQFEIVPVGKGYAVESNTTAHGWCRTADNATYWSVASAITTGCPTTVN